MLSRSRLIVLCLGSYTKSPQLFINFFHVCTDTLVDDTVVMVIRLLTLWRHRAKEGASGVDQILSL